MADEMPAKGMDTSSDMSSYQKWEHDMLEDIGHDTDAIIRMQGGKSMSESYDSGVLAGMLANKGIDPGLIAMLDKGGFGGDSGMLFLLFLVILMGGNGFGGFGGNVDRSVINEGNFTQLMNAISQNGQNQQMAIQTLANNLNADVGQVTAALAQVDKSLAVSNGDIKSAIQSCCCNIRTSIMEQSNQIQAGFGAQNTLMQNLANSLQNQASQIAFAQSQQGNQNTQQILNAIAAQTAVIHDGFCDIRTRELEAEVSRLRDLNAQQRDTANTQLILTALANKDTINATVQGTLDTTAGSFTGTSVGTLS